MPEITIATEGSTTPIATVDGIAKLVEKYYRTWITGGDIVSRYSVFDKTPAEFGGQLEVVRYEPTESVALVRNPTQLEAPNYPTPKKRYFATWGEKKYYVDVAEGRLRRVIGDAEAFAQLVATIINANNEGEITDANKAYENLFYRVFETGHTPTADERKTLIGIVQPADATPMGSPVGFIGASLTMANASEYANEGERLEDLITVIANVADEMTFESTNYSASFCRTSMDRLRVVMPAPLYRSIGISYLAHIRQLQEIGKIPEIIVTPDVSFTDYDETTQESFFRYPVVIADIDAIGRVIQERTVKSTWHDESWSQRYSVAVADMFYYCPLYKCATIIY